MSNVAIRVEGLGKRYRLGEREPYKALRDVLATGISAPFRASRQRGRTAKGSHVPSTALWALKDVSFEIVPGTATGIIGRNGAGKSTLLKILSQIVEPTTGEAEIHGRVGSLLEVGTGFHPELTGRENIYLNGAILGMTRVEIKHRLDGIVAFAEVEKFLDTPVKRYSSGMYVRLAFSVAAHLEPDVLIIDEVLAVGDAEFQRKCLGKLREVATGTGRTILFVSHNMDAVARLCNQCIWLEQGTVRYVGDTRAIVADYLGDHGAGRVQPNEWIDLSHASRIGTGEVRFRALKYTSPEPTVGYHAYSGGPLQFLLHVTCDVPRSLGSLAVVFSNQAGTKLINADTIVLGQTLTLDEGSNYLQVQFDTLYLNPNVYTLSLWAADPISARAGSAYDFIEYAAEIEVVNTSLTGTGLSPNSAVMCDFHVTKVS